IFTIFAVAAGIYGLVHTPLDAIPDLSDVQVIVYTEWEGRSPDLVEDQITYPISSVFIAAPKVKFVRGESMFGKSFIYVIFVGGKIFEVATTEYYIRGRGYIKKIEDIENIVLKVENGTPVYLKNVGNVHLGADLRRGVVELDGRGEVVGGIIVMRYGENALNVIDGVKKKLEEIKASLPEGVHVVTTYDRSDLIKRAIATLRETCVVESIVVALVC